MVYYGTYSAEAIYFHAPGCPEDRHYIEIQKHASEPFFTVSSDCDPAWFYEFEMNDFSDYERVKFNIMETMFRCDDMDELLNALSVVFEDGFEHILTWGKCDCDGNCENCTCKD